MAYLLQLGESNEGRFYEAKGSPVKRSWLAGVK